MQQYRDIRLVQATRPRTTRSRDYCGKYLEEQFYAVAAFGAGLPDSILDGTGRRGQVTGGKQVPFADRLVAQYARELAMNERSHVGQRLPYPLGFKT